MRLPTLRPVNTEEEKEKISLAMYDFVLAVRDTISLPTHHTLFKTTIYSAVVFVVVVICRLLNYYTFLSWQGCLLCTLSLGALLLVERKRNSDMQRAYQVGRKYLDRVDAQRLKGTVKSVIVGKERG